MKTINRVLNVLVLVLLIGIFSSCKEKTSSQVSMRQEWFPYSGYAGELVAAEETSSLFNLDLKIEAGSDLIDPIKMVLSGENEFGVVSADRILSANEKGADLVVIGVVNHISPTCFLSAADIELAHPRDFLGKRVGILTGTNTEFVYEILKAKFEMNEDSLSEVEIPFDLSTFISGNYDIRPAFVYDEPVSLDLQSFKYNLLNPADFNIRFIGTVYFTTREYAKTHPDIVQAFVSSISKGWEVALSDPEKAIGYLTEYDKGIDFQRELLSLKKGMDYFQGQEDKVLYVDQDRWEEMATYMIDLGLIESFDYKSNIDNSYVEHYHR